MAAFNSDDLIFSDAQPFSSPSRARAGEQSIQRIFQDATADRITSKKVVKQLKFTHGGLSPSCRMQHSLWVRRFEATRTAWGQDVSEPYSGDDLMRFFVAIIRKLILQCLTYPAKKNLEEALS